jgi:NADH-quinone oxidoreductase subunit C|tara:strand:+ start:75 stop:515 length:441 start_codon:yes stop_codon:yes gene_type:complete
MTKLVAGSDLALRINEALTGAIVEWNDHEVWVETSSLLSVADFIKDDPELDFSFLTSISAVDYLDYFELVYHLLSMRRNQSAILKTRVHGRAEPVVPSVMKVWRGADLQEREIWDLMGIRFDEHANMKRVLLWEDFPGHPLRKDYL